MFGAYIKKFQIAGESRAPGYIKIVSSQCWRCVLARDCLKES